MGIKRDLVVLSLLFMSALSPALAQAGHDDVATALAVIKDLDRPNRINLATVWDGNKYIQCRRTADNTIACEAAGSLMQPSMERVLTPQRLAALKAMGWRLDASFGNYVRTFGPASTPGSIADEVLAALAQGYGTEPQSLEVKTTSVRREGCPPRNGPSQNLAGVINSAPSMAATAVHACSYRPATDDIPRRLGPQSTPADLIAVYGPRVATEITRLRINKQERVFVVFGTGVGYIQCESQPEPKGILCEAQSADSWPGLAAVLTPERIDRLHAAGFVDPGRSPNYAKSYAAGAIGDAALAAEILTLLHDVYGYYGASKLEVATEDD